MATLKDTPFDNIYGEGKQQEFTTDDGKKYIIRNSPFKNLYGEGYQKEIVEQDKDHSSSNVSGHVIWYGIAVLLAILGLSGVPSGGFTIITGIYLILAAASLIYGIIKAPDVIISVIAYAIAAIIVGAIIFLPLLPGILAVM